MEKNRSSKVIAIIALVVAIVGLSLGFAAFSNTLVISSSANVKPNASTFKVVFSSSNTSLLTEKITGKTTTGATVGEATIVNGETPTISDLTAGFTAPGQSVTYTFYAHNSGEYEAFLKSISYANASGATTPKTCTAVDPNNTTASLVTAACNDISLKVEVGSTSTTQSISNITNHSLPTGEYETVTVTISYSGTNNNRADGDFNVAFGDVSLLYSSADA